MTKRVILLLLVGINLLLAAGLVFSTYSPPQAVAQVISRSGEYILVAAEATEGNDTIYLLDLGLRQLHAFRSEVPQAAGQQLSVRWVQTRDLARDFR